MGRIEKCGEFVGGSAQHHFLQKRKPMRCSLKHIGGEGELNERIVRKAVRMEACAGKRQTGH